MAKVTRVANYLLKFRARPTLTTYQRLIYSKTGVWPAADDELTIDVKKEVEAHWKGVFASGRQEAPTQTSCHDGTKGKKYVLAMFPYPSGKLHMGHVRVYTISDAMARFYQLNGYQVLHPMGWDAFGLPAENAAMERNIMPDKWTYSNIPQMKEQLLQLGCKFNWDQEFATCDPKYYRWTQYIFLLLHRAGLAYQEEALVNWDPVDQTVLADEQVDNDGCSWRSGAKVEKRYLKQWFIKTTRFAKPLLDGLSDPTLEDWRDIIKVQKHWIGDCDGYRVEMEVLCDEENNNTDSILTKLTLWMPDPEYIYGVSFIGVPTGHKLDLEKFHGRTVDHMKVLNVCALCPVTKRKIPIIVSDELQYHEGAEYCVGIPCKNKSDEVIANHCGFDVIQVKENNTVVNSGSLSGSSVMEARRAVITELERSKAGGYQTSAKLRDWLISRQRYWGTPIPIIHCGNCGAVPVPENQLPVTLPKITRFPNKGISPLKEATEWLNCTCPKCGGAAERETDTMDTFVDSSWYFLRFLDPHNNQKPFDFEEQDSMMPVDLYVGGKEHAVLHMFYARFIQHFLASEGMVSQPEPFRRLVTQGMVMGQTYKVKSSGKYLTKDQVDCSVDPPVELGTGEELVVTYEKMSKSKHNGIDPKDVLEEYGCDTTRLLMLANFAPQSQRNWSKDTFPGILNWQNRLWLTVGEFIHTRQCNDVTMGSLSKEEIEEHEQFLWENKNFYIRGTSYNFQHTNQLSVAISYMQGLTGAMRKVPKAMMSSEEFELCLGAQIIMLAPITPHLASELWAGFLKVATSPHTRKDVPLLEQQWPEVDLEYGLPLMCKTQGHDQYVVNIPRRILDNGSVEEVVAFAAADSEFGNCLAGRMILGSRLHVNKGMGGYLTISTNISKEEIQKLKKEKKKLKKEKKEQKKRNQSV